MSIENPPAFPMKRHTANGSQTYGGMTLRDYFAAQFALVAGATGLGRDNALDDEGAAKIAKAAYRIADAMLAARQKGTADE